MPAYYFTNHIEMMSMIIIINPHHCLHCLYKRTRARCATWKRNIWNICPFDVLRIEPPFMYTFTRALVEKRSCFVNRRVRAAVDAHIETYAHAPPYTRFHSNLNFNTWNRKPCWRFSKIMIIFIALLFYTISCPGSGCTFGLENCLPSQQYGFEIN